MKGPFERLKYDLRRVWECPVCRHRERTGGHVTSRICRCQRKVKPRERVCMRLVDDPGYTTRMSEFVGEGPSDE